MEPDYAGPHTQTHRLIVIPLPVLGHDPSGGRGHAKRKGILCDLSFVPATGYFWKAHFDLMMGLLLEIACFNEESAVNAADGGADRIE